MQHIPFLFSVPSHKGGKDPFYIKLRRVAVLLASVLFVAACAGGGGGGGGGSSSAGSGGTPPAPDPSSSEPARIILSQYAASGVLQGFSIHTLSTHGAPIHISNYNPAGALLNYTTYAYDTRNRQTRTSFYNATGDLLRYEVYAYEGSARVPNYHGFYSTSGALVRFEAYTYDANERLSYHGFYGPAGNLTRYAFYNYTAFPDRNATRIDFYDAFGNLTGVEIRTYDAAGQHNHTGFYDANGDLTHYMLSTYADGTLRYVATYTTADELMSYDSYGDANVSPPQAPPPAPAVNLMMDVMPVPDDGRPQPPEDPPARAPAQDTNAPPARTPPTPAIPDEDDDDLPDVIDNCPAKANRGQDDADADGIGDACAAEAVLNLAAVPDSPTAVNLSWMNPSEANLTALNISYQRRDGVGNPMGVDLTQNADLAAGAAVTYRVTDLLNGTTYTFTVGGFDIRHGRITQLLPLASISATTPGGRDTVADRDGDGVPNDADNCPLVANAQDDADGDDIGDACEARAVSGLNVMATNNATMVELSWTNPTSSDLVAMNISYGPTNDPNRRTEMDITTEVPLAADAAVRYPVMNLAANTTYTFVIGGIDFRHGRLNQTLPPASITEMTLPDTDGDGLADGADNCPRFANAHGQGDDMDNDGIGDLCEAKEVLNLAAVADIDTTNVNLSWTNPVNSMLTAMTITYRVGSGAPTPIDITAQVDLSAGGLTSYVVGKERLMGSTNYTFTIGGMDARHGRLDQTLPPVSISQITAPDGDDDRIADTADNCPAVANANGQGDDMNNNGIGDACEAEGVADLATMITGPNTVNLTWTNPAGSDLRAMNISYNPTNDPDSRTAIDLTTAVNLAAGASVHYQVMNLDANTAYTFRIGGIDFRHGRDNQTLPLASTTATTLPDEDDDGVADGVDNCPAVANAGGQGADRDGDGIGDACEAVGVSGLTARLHNRSTVDVSWTNPVNSSLLELRLNIATAAEMAMAAPGTRITIDDAMSLAPAARVTRRLLDLSLGTTYTITVSGIDARHGRANQTLPDVSVSIKTPSDTDADGVLDGVDNCLFTANSGQADADGDTYGDACGPDYDNDGIYEIQTAAQMNASRNNLTVSYELVTDIDLSGFASWTPIEGSFSGAFDGQGHTISNLNISSTAQYVGLFGQTASGAEIHNITLGVNAIRVTGGSSGTAHVGSFVGRAASLTINDAAVLIMESISVSSTGRNNNVGGLIGSATGSSTISRSYVQIVGSGSISASAVSNSAGTGYMGGLVGRLGTNTDMTIRNSYFLAANGGDLSVTVRVATPGAENYASAYTGGMLGYGSISGSLTLMHSYVVGDEFTGSDTGDGDSGAASFIGFYGRTTSNFVAIAPSITNSYHSVSFVSGTPGAYISTDGSARTTQPSSQRSLNALRCPTSPGATCQSATTYTSWDSTIWDFGDSSTLPDLRSNRRR